MTQSGQRSRGAMGELDPLIGRTISGRYRVHALIGQGGMGKVFEAQQIPLGRAVALKVLGATHAGETDAEFQQRFFHEASILAKLKSPHTVTVFDFGRDGDVYFIAMELIAGEQLDKLIRRQGSLSPAHAVTIAIQICRSLREAHTLGVVHRDLKPANVLITTSADGEEHVKVLDFGLAKRNTAGAEDTNPNVVPGSPKYMAPEVIRQEPIDGRADIYALGVMLCYMLTGRVPFDADNPMDILLAHLQQEPPALKALNPNARVPEGLERLIRRCLAKQPSQRYAGMQQVVEALRILGGEVGLHGDIAGGGSLFPAAMTTATGAASPVQLVNTRESGAPASSPGRKSDGPRLRLDQPDFTPSGTHVKRRPILPIVIAAGAIVTLGLVAIAQLSGSQEIKATALPASPGATGATTQSPSANAEEQAAPTTETEQPAAPAEEDAMPSVMITARSRPAGATVLVNGKPMGTTPLSFLWMDPKAVVGESVALGFQLEGHAPKHIRPSIDAEELVVGVALEPLPLEPAAPLGSTEATEPTEPTEPGALPAPPEPKKPVLRIIETEPEAMPEPQEEPAEPEVEPAPEPPAPEEAPAPRSTAPSSARPPDDVFGQPYR